MAGSGPMTMATRQPNRVRIIGGRFRGRVLRFPEVPGLRPTPDRVRETLFNWLGQDLTGWRTLDLYAGSGALSLEALSRGASLAVAVERERALVEALSGTARTLDAGGLELHRADAERFLDLERRSFDAIFLDPPFALDRWEHLLPACAARIGTAGRIYAEADRPLSPCVGLDLVRYARAGQVHYHLFAPGSGPVPTPV